MDDVLTWPDMLDDFAAVNVEPKKPEQKAAPTAAGPARPAAVASEADDKTLEDMLSSDDFAKQLQAGMADLIGELEKNVWQSTSIS